MQGGRRKDECRSQRPEIIRVHPRPSAQSAVKRMVLGPWCLVLDTLRCLCLLLFKSALVSPWLHNAYLLHHQPLTEHRPVFRQVRWRFPALCWRVPAMCWNSPATFSGSDDSCRDLQRSAGDSRHVAGTFRQSAGTLRQHFSARTTLAGTSSKVLVTPGMFMETFGEALETSGMFSARGTPRPGAAAGRVRYAPGISSVRFAGLRKIGASVKIETAAWAREYFRAAASQSLRWWPALTQNLPTPRRASLRGFVVHGSQATMVEVLGKAIAAI